MMFLFHRPWQKEKVEAAPSHLRSPPTEDSIPDPSLPRYHRLCRNQGSSPREGSTPRFRSSPPQETSVQERSP